MRDERVAYTETSTAEAAESAEKSDLLILRLDLCGTVGKDESAYPLA